MDINLMPACDIIGCNEKVLKDIDYCEMVRIIKDIQRNAIEVAVQRCSKEADADVYFHGWLAEESMKSGEPFEEGEDYEVYVINSSILDRKQKLFEENNLI